MHHWFRLPRRICTACKESACRSGLVDQASRKVRPATDAAVVKVGSGFVAALVALLSITSSATPVAPEAGPAMPVSSEAGPTTPPSGWRTETFHGVQLAVPGSWTYGVTGTLWCLPRGPGRAGPYVGRPGGGILMGCGPKNPSPAENPAFRARPGGTFVWFDTTANDGNRWGDTGQQPGTLDAPAVTFDRATLDLAGVRVVVQAPQPLRDRILATIRQVSRDAHGCPTHTRPEGRALPVATLTGVQVVTACKYVLGDLVSSVQLRDKAAAEAVAGIVAAPRGSGPKAPPSCRSLDGENLVVRIDSDRGLSRLSLRWGICDRRGFDDGHQIRALTHRAVHPFVAAPNGVGAVSSELGSIFF